MEDEALQDAHNLFVQTGYKGDVNQFKTLITTNPSALKDAYGLFAKTGYKKSINDFSELLGVKKKDGSEPTSQVQKSVSPSGKSSSALPTDNRPLNSPSKYPVGSMAWNQEKLKQNVKGYTSIYDKFKEVENVAPEKIDEIKQSVDAEINNEGVMNKIATVGRSALNYFTKGAFSDGDALYNEKVEAKKQLAKEAAIAKSKKQPAPEITPETITEKAKQIAIDKRIKSQRESQFRDFVSDLPDGDKNNLTRFSIGELSTIKEDQKVILKKQNVLNDEIDYSLAKIQELNTKAKSLKAKGEELPDDLQKEFQVEHSKYQSLLGDAIKNQNEFISKEGDIGDFTDNIDVFKRNYGALNNVFTNIHATAQELSAGVVGAFDYGLQVKSKFLGKNGTDMIMSDFIGDVSNALNESAADKRSDVERPVSVENINTAHDFGHWIFSDVIANQVPVYALIATGYGGIGAIGASSLGNKYEQMVEEMNPRDPKPGQILMNYSDSELLSVPLGYGIAETASAIVTGMILRNAGRVINSAASAERKTMAQGLWNAVKQSSKGAAIEGLDESATQVAENLLDRYSGKKVALLNGVKDAGSAGAIMGAFLPISSHVVAVGLKPFLTTNNIQKATAEIANYEKQLQNTEISDTSRKVIEKQLEAARAKVNTELSEKIEDVKKLSDKQFTEISSIEKEKAGIKSDAKEIALDDNLDDDTKQQLTELLKTQYNELEQRRVDILERSGYKEFNKLDDEQQIKLKDKAARQLMKEQNPDGAKNITIDNTQILERANKLYKTEQDNLAKEKVNAETKIPITEAQPQAEVQKPSEAEKIENSKILDLEKQRDTEIEALKSKRLYSAENINPIREKYNALIVKEKTKETESKIKRKELFSDGGTFSNVLGESGVDSVPTNHTEINGIEFVEFSNPNTGTVDVVMSGTSDTDFVGYYRIYENGKPTDKWSSKFENQSRNKENFKTMIGGVQSMLPEGHQYTEKTSISTDGLRVWEQQLSRGYEMQTDENGNIVTNEVAINGDAIVNELGIDVNQGNFDNISVTNNQQFQSVKKALLPYLQKFGLNESNIRNVNGTVEIDLPVLRKTKKQNEQTPQTPEAQPQAEAPQQAEAEKVDELGISDKITQNKEVSPVEDVVATSVEKKTIKQLEAENKTTLPKIPSNKIFKNEVTPLTQNQTKGVDKIIEQNKENDLPTQKIDIGLIVPTQKTVNTNNLKKTSEITEETKISEPIVLVKENGKYYVVDGHHRISNEILNGNTIVEAKVFDNEATPNQNKTKSLFTGRKKEIKDFKETKGEFIFFSQNEGIAEKYGKVTRADVDTENFLDLSSQEKKSELIESMTDDEIIKVFKIKESDRSRFPKPISEEVTIFKESVKDGSQRFSAQGELQTALLRYIKSKGYDGVVLQDAQYGKLDNSYVVFNKNVINKNEATPPTNTPTNGNLSIGTSVLGESGTTVEDSAGKESVPSAVNVGKSESDNEVNLEDIQNFINETYLKDEKSSTTTEADQGAVKNSNRENRAIPIGEKGKKQVKVTKEGKVSLQGRKALAKRQFKGDRKTASQIDPTDATSLALRYFVNGGKISSDYFNSQGERQARSNGLHGIAAKEAKTAKGEKATIDAVAHEIWESQENSELKLSTEDIKNAVEEVVNGNLTVQDAVASILGKYNVEEQNDADYEKDYAQAIQEYQQEENYSEEHIQEVESVLDYLSDAEIIELANSQEKSFDDYAKDIESRQVTYDLGPFSEKGTIQPDGWILSENGELLSPQSVRNVKQVNLSPEAKVEAKKDLKTLGVSDSKSEQRKDKANAEVDTDLVSKEYYEKFQKDFPNTLLAIEEKNGLITIFENGETREVEDYEFVKELKNALAKGYKGIGKVTRKVVDTETKKLRANAEVDKIADKIKEILPGIKDPDLKKQGISQDDLIDLVASTVKTLVSKGIDINDAIRQVISSIKERFNVDVDENLVKEKLEDTQSREVSKEIKSNESLDKLLANIPKSAEVKQYLSGETIEKYEGEKPSNDQDYLKQELYPALEHGVKILDKFKEDFGDQYIDKVLSYLDGNNVPVEAKALLYVTLENDLATRKKSEIDNELQISKLQDLVRAKSQRHLRAASLAINFGRLRQFAQSGYDLSKVTNQLFSSEELEGRSKIEKAVQASADEINNEAEVIEQGQIDDYVEKAIQEGVSKQIDEIYKRLPSSRKIKADKTIKALEKVQKNLRSKTYDASIGIPVAIIDSGITVIKNAIKAGVNIADAIEYGIEHIKEKYGKEWANENAFRKDMHEGLKSEGVDMTSEEKTKAAQAKQLVKDALIERGFGREITVTKKEVDADGNVNRVKEKRNIVDWKKLAGEEGSIDRIRKNVESALEEKGYSESEVNAIKDDLEQEYNNIRASVIEKSINELVNRNTPRKPVDVKTSAKRLAELYNYGLFEKESDTYDHLLNNAVGLNSIGQKAFNDAKLLAKSLADLYNTNVDGRKVNEFGIKHAVRVINKQIEDLLTKVAWEQSNKVYKSSTVVKEYVGLSQRMMLNSVKQLVENPLSGAIQRVFTNIGFANEKTDSKELSKNRSEIARKIYEDTIRNGGLSYGDITTPLVSKSKIEDYLNGKADTKTKHTLLSYAMGRAYLEGADSMHKSALTERYFSHNLIKILSDKSNPNKMSREDAVKYVSEQLTGQSFEDAKNTAQQIIEKANKDAGKEVLPNNKESVNRLAQDIVKDALVNGKKITIDEIEASYKAAYKAAGFDLGHEANNPISKGVGNLSAKVEYNIEKAIKEKKWNEAAAYTFESILTRNILNPFVGGGTNWVVLTLQKTGVDFVSPLVNYAKAKDNRLDLSTDAGMKNLENALLQSLKYKNSMTRFTVGAMASIIVASGAIASGAADDLEDWLKKNEWARRYFNVVAPQSLIALLAAKDENMGRYFGQLLNIRTGEMNEGVKLTSAAKNYSKGNIDQALGTTGDLIGSKLSAPVPFRFVRDAQNIVRGIIGKPQIKVEFQTKGFWNGYFKGGLFEYMGLRPETSNSFQNPKAKELQEKYIKLNSMKNGFAKNKLKQEIDKLEKKLFEEADKKAKEAAPKIKKPASN